MRIIRSKQSTRHLGRDMPSGGWWRVGKPSVLSHQKVVSRAEGRVATPKIDAGAAQLGGGTRLWRVAVRQWVTHGVGGGVLLAVEFVFSLKNCVDFFSDLALSGWELLGRRRFSVDALFATLPDTVVPEDLPDHALFSDIDWGQDWQDGPVWIGGAAMPREQTGGAVMPREQAETDKMVDLATEEEDLPDTVLDDQAGALRSRLARVGRKEVDL